MKSILIAIVSFCMTLVCCAQNTFVLSSEVEDVNVFINGKQYFLDTIGIEIPTNYPKFDTLEFLEENKTPIICNFKPDSVYVVTLACCAELDIMAASKLDCDSLQYWDVEKDLHKIHNQLLDKPFISIKTKKEPSFPIFAWHADVTCETEYKIINTELWRLGIPPKGFYWKNITVITFFKQDNNLIVKESEDLEKYLGIDNIVELAYIRFRLFDNEQFILIFDEINNTVEIEYE